MKKSIVSALTTALVIGAASTTFAAANPFEDVPADHWAYDAIAQLAADGVIEGYGDGTYRGDQEITRYEMAQMVARAMAKNASGVNKAMIDKLAAEFADELNSLGVRVANLEKKVDNVKWLGTVRYRYITERHDRTNIGGEHEKLNSQYITLRLEPEMQINKNWSGHARIDYSTDFNSAKNATNGQIETDGTDEMVVERMWVQGDYNNLQILLGKLPYVTYIDGGMIYDENVSGGQLTVGNKIKGTVTVGRASAILEDFTGTDSTTASYQGIEIYNDREDKITWGVGFHHVRNRNQLFNQLDNGEKDYNIWDVGLGWQIDNNFNLNGAYAWNTSVNETVRGNDTKHAWTVELDYKGADPEDAGSWGAFVAYRKLGNAAVLAPTYDAIGAGQKGVEMGFDIVPMKNFQATFKYFTGKDMNGGNGVSDNNANKFFTELNFFF
jgi:hypothetical protein